MSEKLVVPLKGPEMLPRRFFGSNLSSNIADRHVPLGPSAEGAELLARIRDRLPRFVGTGALEGFSKGPDDEVGSTPDVATRDES